MRAAGRSSPVGGAADKDGATRLRGTRLRPPGVITVELHLAQRDRGSHHKLRGDRGGPTAVGDRGGHAPTVAVSVAVGSCSRTPVSGIPTPSPASRAATHGVTASGVRARSGARMASRGCHQGATPVGGCNDRASVGIPEPGTAHLYGNDLTQTSYRDWRSSSLAVLSRLMSSVPDTSRA